MESINVILLIIISHLIPIPYPQNLGGEPVYLELGGRKGGPVCTWIVLVLLQILQQIDNTLTDTSDIFGPGVALSIPQLSHHPLGLIDITHERFSLAPGTLPLHIVRPRPLPNIPPPPQHVINPPPPPLKLHVHWFVPPVAIRRVPLSVLFASLRLICGGSYLGLKFDPCLLQFVGRHPPEGHIIPSPHPLHILSHFLYPKSPLNYPSLSLSLSSNVLSLMSPYIDDLTALSLMEISYILNSHILLLIFNDITYP